MEIDLGEREVKFELLHEELQTALGDSYKGLSSGRGLVAYLDPKAGKEAVRVAREIVNAHNPQGMTQGEQQLAELNEARNKALGALGRMAQDDPIVQVLNWIAWELVRLRD